MVEGAACTAEQHQSSESVCSGSRVLKCDQTGDGYTWTLYRECADWGKSCSDGSCVSAGQGGSGGTGGSANSCFQACDAQYPTGVSLWQTMASCIYCGACFDICTAEDPSLCISGSELGCSSSASSCSGCIGNTTCVQGACYDDIVACQNSSVCTSLDSCYGACP